MKSKIVCLSKNNEFKEILRGKKKLGTAVIRNKIKRKLRNITNEAVKSLSLRLDYSYLVIAKETVLKNDYSDIKKTMFNEFNKIK